MQVLIPSGQTLQVSELPHLSQLVEPVLEQAQLQPQTAQPKEELRREYSLTIEHHFQRQLHITTVAMLRMLQVQHIHLMERLHTGQDQVLLVLKRELFKGRITQLLFLHYQKR